MFLTYKSEIEDLPVNISIIIRLKSALYANKPQLAKQTK